MGARQKLNVACINGAAVIAAILGLVCGSWTVFFLVLVPLVWSAYSSNDIRLTSDHHNRPTRDRPPH